MFITFKGIGIDGLWFLPTIFIAEILFISINEIIKNGYIKILLIAYGFAYETMITKGHEENLLVLARILIALGFITVGYHIFDIISNREVKGVNLIVIFIIQILMAKYNGFVDLNNLVFDNSMLYLLNSAIGTFIIVQISKK